MVNYCGQTVVRVPWSVRNWRLKRNKIVAKLLKEDRTITSFQALQMANRIMREEEKRGE